LSTAFEAGRAEVLAWEQAASVPSAGITLQQTDTLFAGVNWPSQGRAHQRPTSNGRPLMTHLIDKNLVERANTVLLLGILWAALALCVLGALSYDILYWLEGW
jgi:hypothetical protein